MIPECEGSTAVEIVGAVGGVATALVTLYLVHRRILADRETRFHREEEANIHRAVVAKLGIAEAELERRDEARRKATKPPRS